MTSTDIYNALVKLLDSQFEHLLFKVRAPVEHFPPANAPLSNRALALANWANQTPERLLELQHAVREVAPHLLHERTSMKLTGAQSKVFVSALMSAFPSIEALSRMVREELNVNLSSITSGHLGEASFNLLVWAEVQGWAEKLYVAARNGNPGNPDLRAINYFPNANNTTPVHSKQETPVTYFNDRPVHLAHIKSMQLLVCDALATDAEKAALLLKRLFGADVTYAELPNLKSGAITRAIDKALGDDHEIPETRVEELIHALQGVTPDRRYCGRCGRFDLTRKAGRWTPVTQPTCLHDQGVYVAVAFPKPFQAWTDHKWYEPGTVLDASRIPITEEGLLDYVQKGGGSIHWWLSSNLMHAKMPLTKFADFLLWKSGIHTNPESPAARVAVIRALTDPTSFALNEVDVRLMVESALKANGGVLADVLVDGGVKTTVVGPGDQSNFVCDEKALRSALARVFQSEPRLRMLVNDSGLNPSRIDFSGSTENVAYWIVEEARKQLRLRRLVTLACEEYPNDAELRSLLGA